MRALRIAAVVVLLCVGVAQAGHRPVAQWDVVADQRIDAPFKAGVVAFHPDGVKVEFRVNGSLVHTANNPTLNDRVNVWEFWFTFDPSNYSDGAVTLDAKAVPLNGTDPSYDLASLNLYANSGGSLDVATVKWADAVNGSDANPGTESQPYATLAKAVQNTPAGGTIYLKAGTYCAASLGGGNTRAYWTTVAAADGLGWNDVEISPGRPSTDRLRLKNLSIFTTNTSGSYTTILTGENGGNVIWLDNVKAWNKNGRYAASTNVFGNRYNAYTTGGLTTEVCNGPGGKIVRDHAVETITSDVFTGENRLVVNCTVDDVDKGSTSAHPDFHQAYAVAPDYCENMVMYNVKAVNCSCQGFFGSRLINSAFVNVLFERVPDVSYYSQYSSEMTNDMWFHVTLVNQTWLWRGAGSSALDADGLNVANCVFGSMRLHEDATAAGLTIDTNHFNGDTMGTNVTTGDPLFVNAAAEDFSLQSTSPAYGSGKYLQCVPADVDGVAYSSTSRNKGCFAGSGGAGNAAPIAHAGADQTVTDSDDDGSENVTLDASGSYDLDGTISSYLWKEGTTQIATGVGPTVSFSVAAHTVELTVTDDESATDTDTVVITVNAPANIAPTADAGADQTVTDSDDDGSESVALDGSGSSDSDGTISSYVWTEGSTQIATGVSPTVSFSVDAHAIELTVTDDDSATDSDTVIITVNAPAGGGQTYTINGDTADNVARSNLTVPWPGGSTFRVGGDTSTTDAAAVYVFQLPTLGAGETISTANLDAHLYRIANNPGGAVDLYGLGYRAAATVQGTDFYQGAYDGDSTDAWALQDDFAVITTPDDTIVSTDSAADAALANYLAAQYAAGAQGGEYVFLRLSPDVTDQTNYYYWEFTSANGSSGPVLTIETSVPAANDPPVADAGADQTVTDSDDNGAENVTLDGSGSSDSDGTISSYVWTEDSTQIATGVSPTVSFTVGAHAVDLTVTDDDGATDVDSVAITVNEWSVTSSTAWQNFAIDTQTGRFLFEFDATPNNAGMDGVTGVCSGEADWWSDIACIVRFAAAGVIDVRDGGSYAADATLTYTAGTSYHVCMDVNLASHTYSVTITPDGGSAVALATDYDFRSEQATVTSLDHWVLNATNVGDSHTVSDVLVTPIVNAAPVADAGADQTVADSDGDGAASVTLDGSGSSDSDGTIDSYVWSEDESQIATGASPTVSMDVGVYTIDLTVTDDDDATDSDTVEVTVVSRTLTSSTSEFDWPASTLPSQTGTFTCEFDVVPAAGGIDGVTGLSYGAADWWNELACIVRFNTSGSIDARDGGSYAADATVNYSADTTYHIRMVVDVPNVSYSVYVTPAGGSETTLATDYDFRTEQQSITSIDNWTLNATNSVDTHTVSNLTITD